MTVPSDWGVVVLDDEDVTFVMCTCGLVVRLSSAFRHDFKETVRDKHAAFCDGRPGSHAERQEYREANDPAAMYNRQKRVKSVLRQPM